MSPSMQGVYKVSETVEVLGEKDELWARVWVLECDNHSEILVYDSSEEIFET